MVSPNQTEKSNDQSVSADVQVEEQENEPTITEPEGIEEIRQLSRNSSDLGGSITVEQEAIEGVPELDLLVNVDRSQPPIYEIPNPSSGPGVDHGVVSSTVSTFGQEGELTLEGTSVHGGTSTVELSGRGYPVDFDIEETDGNLEVNIEPNYETIGRIALRTFDSKTLNETAEDLGFDPYEDYSEDHDFSFDIDSVVAVQTVDSGSPTEVPLNIAGADSLDPNINENRPDDTPDGLNISVEPEIDFSDLGSSGANLEVDYETEAFQAEAEVGVTLDGDVGLKRVAVQVPVEKDNAWVSAEIELDEEEGTSAWIGGKWILP